MEKEKSLNAEKEGEFVAEQKPKTARKTAAKAATKPTAKTQKVDGEKAPAAKRAPRKKADTQGVKEEVSATETKKSESAQQTPSAEQTAQADTTHFTNKSPFTQAELNALNNYLMFGKRLLYSALIFLPFAFLLNYLAMFDDPTFYPLALYVVVGGIISEGFYIGFYMLIVLIAKSSTKNLNPYCSSLTMQHFTFEDDKLSVLTTMGDNKLSEEFTPYAILKYAAIYKNYTFLFISTNRAYIINNFGFENGSLNDLIKLLVKNNVKIKK